MDHRISHFNNSRISSIPDKVVLLKNVVSAIKTGSNGLKKKLTKLRSLVDENGEREPSYSYYKEMLPSFTISGVFNLRKKDVPIVSYTKLTILDIDSLKKQGVDINELKNKIRNLEEIVVSFISPSGDGIKIIVLLNSESIDHSWATIQVMNHFSKLLKIEIDPSGKDITRLCYYSYDADIYINSSPKSFNVSLSKPMDERIRKAIKFTSQKVKFVEGSRNNFIYILSCNLNRYGIALSIAIEACVSKYEPSGFPEEEITNIINWAYNSHKQEHGKWERYNINEKVFSSKETSNEQIDEIQHLLNLNQIKYSDEEMAKFMIQVVQNSELDNWRPYLIEGQELLDIDETLSANSWIIKNFLEDINFNVDSLKKCSSPEMKLAIDELIKEKCIVSGLSDNGIRLFILRYKLKKLKSRYSKTAKTSSFLDKQNLLRNSENLLKIKEYNNSLVQQIKAIFATVLESGEL